jgi:hypothetical protein
MIGSGLWLNVSLNSKVEYTNSFFLNHSPITIWKIHSEETKQKISKAKSGIKQTEESNQKRRNALIGKQRPDTVGKKISEAKKGKPVWNTGKIMEKFICSICGKQVGGKGNLVQHKNKHLPNWLYL